MYFQKSPVHGLSKQGRQYIIQKVARIRSLIQSQQQLQQDGFVFPLPNSPPIPELGQPRTDGLGCKFEGPDGKPCPVVYRHQQQIREHYIDTHGWVNPQTRGRPSREDQAREKPWREGVYCQRFFDHSLYSGFFEVQSQPITASTETPKAKAQKSIQERINSAREKEKKKIKITDLA